MVLCLSSDGPWAAQSFPRLWLRSLLIDSSWMIQGSHYETEGGSRSFSQSNFGNLLLVQNSLSQLPAEYRSLYRCTTVLLYYILLVLLVLLEYY
jgi:hypothetical protein